MAKQTISITHRDIIQQIKDRKFAPIYLLMGDESYYIDRISEYIADNILSDSERDFNQHIIYCTKETKVGDIINSARRYPMMSEYQVVIVKEAQNLLKIEELATYAKNFLKTTILVICYKNGSLDSKKKFVAAIREVGIVFESKKLREGMLPSFITDYLKRKQITIDQQATMMLAQYIGSDLNRIASELDKLAIALPPGFKQINTSIIEKNIGISKEFNNWELRTSLVNRDILKANQIINFFEANPKENPASMTISTLFTFFSNIMLAYYSSDKTTRGLMEQLDLKAEWQLKEYTQAMRTYSAMKTMQIIGKIRETDCKLKGVRKGNTTDGDIMRELIYFILH
jgi:DNA polymerase-3 subunit delta